MLNSQESAKIPSMTETSNRPFAFSTTQNSIEAFSPFVQLSSAGAPLEFALTMQKEPTSIRPGMIIEKIEFDIYNPALSDIRTQIDEIKKSAEVKRPRMVLELLRSKIQYPYEWVLQELTQVNAQQAEWVKNHITDAGSKNPRLRLSDIISFGYGECRHFAVSYLYLAHEAGLTVALSNNGPDNYIGGGPGPIKNIPRRDDGQKLFKSCEIGKPIWAGHEWVEIKLGDRWMPVDPTTNLVGDNDEERTTFLDANYRAVATHGLSFQSDHPRLSFHLLRSLDFPVYQSVHTGTFTLNCEAAQKPITLNPEKKAQYTKEKWLKPTKHSGPLKFVVSSHQTRSGLTVSLINIQELQVSYVSTEKN